MATDNREALYAAMVKLQNEKGGPFTVAVRAILAAFDMPEAERPSNGTIGNIMESLVREGCVSVTDNGQRAPKTYAVLKPFSEGSNGNKPAVVPQPAPLTAVAPTLVAEDGEDALAARFGPVRAAVEAARQRQRELRMEIERLTELYEAGEKELKAIGGQLQAPLQVSEVSSDKPAAEAIAS